ncbi:hypothetical protein ADL33_06780 [Streptomyces sp. NRRL WC-3604]|nr:hypothetical protein ADL33_06780 [Streptomyces sp. NRRL WC-3604]
MPPRSNEVGVLVLDHAFVDPPPRHCARGLFGSSQCVRRFLSRGNESAELLFVLVGGEWWELHQVEGPLMADVLNGMEVDLIRRLRWADLDVADSDPTWSTYRTEELFHRTTSLQRPSNGSLRQVSHPAKPTQHAWPAVLANLSAWEAVGIWGRFGL